MTKKGRGRRVAQLFRQVRNLSEEPRTCDLEAVLTQDPISVDESFYADPGYTACLVRPDPSEPWAGILLAPGQNPGRKRFSIAHELGHYHIPGHARRPPGWCGEEAMTAGPESSLEYEWEANDFAAELLMPWRLFAQDAARRDPVFGAITELAAPDLYHVSITAAALRYVEVTDKRCALLSARDHVIEWVARSDPCTYRIPWKGDRVPSGSVAAAVMRGESIDGGQATEVEPYVWLEIEQTRPVEVFESTHHITSQSQVLSLVWVVPEGSWE